MTMPKDLELLVALQDLDIMIREVKDNEEAGRLKDMGFDMSGLEKLEAARADLTNRIPDQLLTLYNRVSKRFGRAVVPVSGSMCLGCFITLPTSFTSSAEKLGKVQTCESCGRILYFP